jgi:hypothetical protein
LGAIESISAENKRTDADTVNTTINEDDGR